MKCPFCNSELHKDSDGYYTCYTDNCECWGNGGNGASGSESLWLTLIRTRKALEIAVDALKEYTDEKRWDWERCYELHSAETANTALEQITTLEQKDK